MNPITLYQFSKTIIPQEITIQLVGGSYSGGGKWAGGVLAPNGKIYFAPYDASQILELDPTTNTTQLVGSVYGGYYDEWRVS